MTTIAKHATAATKKSKPADHTIDRRHRDNADAADCMTGAKPSSITVVRVGIADIAVPEKSRNIRQDTVDGLAASMKQIGLRTPISVRNSKKGNSARCRTSPFRGREEAWLEAYRRDRDA